MSTQAIPFKVAQARRWRQPLPGRGISLGLGLMWLGLVVLLPLAALVWRAAGLGRAGWLHVLRDPRVQASLAVSFETALVAALSDFRLVSMPHPLRRALQCLGESGPWECRRRAAWRSR